MRNTRFLIPIFWFGLLFSCQQTEQTQQDTSQDTTEEVSQLESLVPDWAKTASIYEVNLRQFSTEGTIEAFRKHLPRIKEMGIDILWFMPMHPISEAKRKGTLGSYYAVADYRGINPEYGTMEDFDAMVQEIHDLGMYIIIDWVPNHTGWDHAWITEHPDYYTQDSAGNIIDPINTETGESWGWTDVADLNYDNPEMRIAMIEDLKFWLDERNIDGYRMDVAHGVPVDFWTQLRDTLISRNKPVFMLAEGEVAEHRNTETFIMSYAWNFQNLMHEIAKDEKDVSAIDEYLKEDRSKFQKGYHMYFTSNHDENTWAGTEFDRYGDGHQTFAVLTSTLDGMPLIYNGQEEPLTRRLEFFEKDSIGWGKYENAEFYKTLFTLKENNEALWNGEDGAEPERINDSKDVYAFKREKGDDQIVVVLNFSDQNQKVNLSGNYADLTDIFSNESWSYEEGQEMEIEPWGYKVYSKN